MEALARAVKDLGPIPAALETAIVVAYANLRRLIASSEGFANYKTRSHRSIVHDHTWHVARSLLSEFSGCEIVETEGADVLHYGRYMVQVHKIDENFRININGTERSHDILGQGHLWESSNTSDNLPVWLTVGHLPDDIAHTPRRIIIGIATEGGMATYSRIEADLNIVASIGPNAAAQVKRLRGMTG